MWNLYNDVLVKAAKFMKRKQRKDERLDPFMILPNPQKWTDMENDLKQAIKLYQPVSKNSSSIVEEMEDETWQLWEQIQNQAQVIE